MEIAVKQGVWISRIDDLFIHFCRVLNDVWGQWGNIPTLTSGADGKHAENSKHYTARAWDIRVWGLKDPAAMAADLRAALNVDGDEWDVIFGDAGHKDHIHVEAENFSGRDL